MMKDYREIITHIHNLLIEKRLTVAVAESCTGGLVSHYLTLLSGASRYFKAGIIAYSNESKKRLLGVTDRTIETYGAVSQQTSIEMSEKIRNLIDTDYSISTTGNLGPDVMEGKEKGLIYISVSNEKQTITKELRLTGERNENKEKAAIEALFLLFEQIKKNQAL